MGTLCRGYIEDLIEEVGFDDRQKELIRLRYICNYSVTETAMEMFISPETYHRIHRAVLLKIKSFIVYSQVKETHNYLIVPFL